MENNKTFTMIKPDGVANGHIGGILDKIIQNGFKIVAMKYTALSADKSQVNSMQYTKSAAFIQGSGCIHVVRTDSSCDLRKRQTLLKITANKIGATDPTKAEAGTIRNLFAKSIDANAVHGSRL